MGSWRSWIKRFAVAGGVVALGLGYTQAFLSPTSSASSVAGWSSPVLVDSAASGFGTLSTQSEEGGYPEAISCASSSFCAVADDAGNVVTFNGSTWSTPQQVSSPPDNPYFTGISCPTDLFCAAVSGYGTVYTYNGSTWSGGTHLPFQSDNSEVSISCTSSQFCLAVDYDGDTATFNGTTWSALTSYTGLSSVSCVSPTFCMAAGADGTAALYTGGATWASETSVDATNGLSRVSCSSSTFCMATDRDGNAYTYDGAVWSGPTLADASTSGYVSCASASFCLYADQSGNVAQFDGLAWSAPAAVDTVASAGIACTSSAFCMDVDQDGYATEFDGTATPAVFDVSPVSGPTTGTDAVTVAGVNLGDASTVAFGTTPAPGFTVVSDDELSVTTPAHAAGVVDVTVTTPSGTSVSSSRDLYSFGGVPTVSSVTADEGPASSSTVVTISGTGFSGASSVAFGLSDATAFTVESATSIQATTPSEGAGAVNVTVTTLSGTSPISTADEFTYVTSLPVVTSVSPASGPATGQYAGGGGGMVTITGANFSGATQVAFGGKSAGVTVNSSTSLSAYAPTEPAGTVDTTVTTPSGTSATSPADYFTYVYVRAPIVSSISPDAGLASGGTSVTISGSTFSNVTQVWFGSTQAQSFMIDSDTSITAVSPAGSGVVDVGVDTATASSIEWSGDRFTYVTAGPTVTAVVPSSGTTVGGTGVTITGTNFVAPATVAFGSTAGTDVVVNSPTSISAVSPAGTGVVDVTVTTPNGTSPDNPPDDQFTYCACGGIYSIVPDAGPTTGGTHVTITGADLSGTTAVAFGAFPAQSFTVNSDTSISAVSPAGTGVVDVIVTTSTGTFAANPPTDQFTYVVQPTVATISPDQGPAAGGTPVDITGTGLTGTSAINFGDATVSGYVVHSSTSVSVPSPSGMAAGCSSYPCTVPVNVTTPGGTSASAPAGEFTYYLPLPAVTGVSPSSGPTAGATAVTITGSGFTGATAVEFGTKAALSFSVHSGTEITASAPPEPAGPVDVTVTGPGGTSSLSVADHYVYVAPPPIPPASPSLHGYWLVAGDGGIFTYGAAHFFGSTGNLKLQRPVVGMTPTGDDQGYWMVATDGGMFAFGDARFYGSIPGLDLAPAGSSNPKRLAAPIVAMVASPSGGGYLLVASDGGVFAFGDALFYGSCPGIGGCSGQVVAVVPDHGEHGYWIVTSTGHVYAFGNAASVATGEPGATPAPITGATASGDGRGYLIVDAKGDVYAYGDAKALGSAPGAITVPGNEIVGIVATSDGNGYWLMGRTGAIYNYGDATNDGSMAGKHLNAPIVTAAGF